MQIKTPVCIQCAYKLIIITIHPCFFALQSIQLLHNEDMRSTKYLHPSSYNLVKMQLEERLSSDHLEMLHTECPVLVQQESSKGESSL